MLNFFADLLSYDITVLILVIGIVIAAAYALHETGGPWRLDEREDHDLTPAVRWRSDE